MDILIFEFAANVKRAKRQAQSKNAKNHRGQQVTSCKCWQHCIFLQSASKGASSLYARLAAWCATHPFKKDSRLTLIGQYLVGPLCSLHRDGGIAFRANVRMVTLR